MQTLKIVRLSKYGQQFGTFSAWYVNGNYFCKGVELPWQDNRPEVSCIPPGKYIAELYESPKHGLVYQLKDVPERTSIQIHSANFGTLRDTDQDGELEGEQLQGCLAPGHEVCIFPGGQKWGVTKSRDTLARLMAVFNRDTRIEVEIING